MELRLVIRYANGLRQIVGTTGEGQIPAYIHGVIIDNVPRTLKLSHVTPRFVEYTVEEARDERHDEAHPAE